MRHIARLTVALLFVSTFLHAATLQKHSQNLGDTNADLVYTPLGPCRIIDTRVAGGFMLGGTTRSFKVAGTIGFDLQGGTAGGCGVPVGATSVLINFVAVSPDAIGNLKGSAYPNPIPTTGSIINYQLLNPALNVANAVAFPICDPSVNTCAADITLFTNGGGCHVVADVLGYFKRFPKEQTITSVNAGTGMTGGGTAGDVTLNVAFAGSGTANTAARSDHSHYTHTIIVSPGATPAAGGTALLNAISGITTSSATNPYLVKIEPGVYDLGGATANVPPYVEMEGSGEDATTIQGSAFNTVGMLDHSALRRLTVSAVNEALNVTNVSATVEHVTLVATNPAGTAIAAVFGTSGTYTLDHVTISVTSNGGTALYLNQSGVSPLNVTLHHVTLTATGAGAATGQMQALQTSGTNVDADDLRITINATGTAHVVGISGGGAASMIKIRGFAFNMTNQSVSDGVFHSSGSSMDLADGTFNVAAGTGGATGILNIDANLRMRNVVLTVVDSATTTNGTLEFSATVPRTVVIQNSEIVATGSTVNTSGGNYTVQVSNTRLFGGPVLNGTIPTQCSFVTDENMLAFNNSCP